MRPLEKADLRELLAERPGPCVSLYMPTHRKGAEVQQDPLRLKNLLKRAEKDMASLWLDGGTGDGVLAPAEALLPRKAFWEHASDGLALFLAPGYAKVLQLPVHFEELCAVGPRFRLTPLLPLLDAEGHCYTLALSQNQVRLLRCTRYDAEPIALPEAPKSLEDALRYDDPESSLQFHTASGSRRGGRRTAVFHGQGTVEKVEKDNLLRFFRRVDKGIRAALQGETAPLVLACVEYYVPIYREANTYGTLFEGSVTGNPEHASDEELRQASWSLVEGRFLAEREDARKRFLSMAGTGRTGDRLDDVLEASEEGRVHTLFVAYDRHVWGYLEEGQRVRILDADAPSPGAEDLLDRLAAGVLAKGGTVWAVPAEDVPGDALIAAIYRY